MPTTPKAVAYSLAALLAATSILGSGCATVTLDTQARLSIATVRIEPISEDDVTIGGELPLQYDIGPNAWYGSIYTAPIGIVYDIFHHRDNQAKRGKILQRIFAESDIDVPVMVHAQFLSQLADSEIFGSVTAAENEPADANLRIAVGYGVHSIGMADEMWMPWVEVTGTLTDRAGQVIWRRSVEVNARNGDLRELPFPNPFQDPPQVRRNFRSGARLAVARLIAHMKGDSTP